MKTERVMELASYDLMDTPAERPFDDIVYLAQAICNTPIVLLSFIDDDRQWVKAKIGVDENEFSPAKTFCGYALMTEAPLVVEDATLNERFAEREFVAGEAHLRFYAGVPVFSPFGHAIGMICVIDTEPRKLEANELASLLALSRQVTVLIEMRRNNIRAIEISQLLEA